MLRHYAPLNRDYTRSSKKKNPICGFFGEYRFLSNFWFTPVHIWDIEFPTSEHAFMWSKSEDEKYRRQILEETSPLKVKQLGNNNRLNALGLLREDWIQDVVRIHTMYEILKAKYRVERMWKLLDATGNRYLEETNTWNDKFWGRCDREGHNHLGRLSMVVRYEGRL